MGIFNNSALDTVEWASPRSHCESPGSSTDAGPDSSTQSPLSPPAHTPVPRGDMNKRGECGGGRGVEEGYDIEVAGQCNPNKVNDLVHQHKCRGHFETLCLGLQELPELNLQALLYGCGVRSSYTTPEHYALIVSNYRKITREAKEKIGANPHSCVME